MRSAPESHDAERELNEWGEGMTKSLEDLVVSKASSEKDLREAFKDCLAIKLCVDLVMGDIHGGVDIRKVQSEVDKIVVKHRLDPKKFSLHKLRTLIDAY